MDEMLAGANVAARQTVWPAWPCFDEDEIQAVASILRNGKVNYWTGGIARRFETQYAKRMGCSHGVALANGTVALELALRVLGIGPGDDVIVTARSFVASASCVFCCGAKPVFADVDPISQNVTAQTIEEALTPNARCVIVVHLYGWPCEMNEILDLANRRGLKVIEDCAQAHGSEYRGQPVGSFGDCAAWSFCQDKILSTGGEGGLLTTNSRRLYEAAWSYKDHGRGYDAAHADTHAPGFRWLIESVGTNWRMTEPQAAIGMTQLAKLDGWVETRRRNASILSQVLGGLPALRICEPSLEVRHAYYRYVAFLLPERLREGWNHNRIIAMIEKQGGLCRHGICPEIYREAVFEKHLGKHCRLPVARQLGEASLEFPVHPTLSEQDMKALGSIAAGVIRQASV